MLDIYGVDERLDLILDSDVAGHGQRLRPRQLSQPRRSLPESSRVPVGHDDGRALLRGPLGRGKPDTGAGRRRDKDDLVAQQPMSRRVRRGFSHGADLTCVGR